MIIDKKSTSDVLKQYQELGFDLAKPTIIEFFIEGSQKNLQSIESQIISYRQDVQISIEQNEFGGMWTCYCSVNIVPSLENILAIETTLFGIAQKNDCNYEGFGSYGN
ncbi:TPA: ribonuclease E inhibitor RraB [Neisseria meningitidis]